jgi:hypothetical protein
MNIKLFPLEYSDSAFWEILKAKKMSNLFLKRKVEIHEIYFWKDSLGICTFFSERNRNLSASIVN